MVLVVLVILFTLRHKKQKTIVLEQPQGAVLENRDPFTMIRNDAYAAVIATERNEAYMTNTFTNNPEPQGQTAHDQSGEEYSYALVR